MKTILNIENLLQVVGEKIEWEAPIYEGNKGHFGNGKAGGICIVNKIDVHQQRPFVDVQLIEGDDITYSFIDELDNGNISFSDSYRNVSFEII